MREPQLGLKTAPKIQEIISEMTLERPEGHLTNLLGRSPQICTVRDSVTSQKNIFFPSILIFLKITSLKYMC